MIMKTEVRHMKKRILSYFLISANLLMLTSCGGQDVPELISSDLNLSVYYTVVKGNLEESAVYDATVVPDYQEVYSEISGEAYNVNYKIGDTVKKGDIVFSIYENLDEEILNLEEELSQYETISEYYIEQHDADINSMKSKKSTMSGMDAELYDLDIQAKQLEYQKDEDERADEYETMLTEYDELLTYQNHTDIVAPCDGIITAIAASGDGKMINQDVSVLTVADESERIIQFEYQTSDELSSLLDIYIQIGSDIYKDFDFLEYTDEEIAYMEDYGKDYYSRAVIDGLSEDVKFGDYVAVFEAITSKSDCIYVPEECIFTDNVTGQDYVKKLNADGYEENIYITSGETIDGNVVIEEGLSVGDKIYYCEDSASWKSEPSYTTVYTGDYVHTMEFSDAYKSSDDCTYFSVPINGTVSEIYMEATTDLYVEEGEPLFAITPNVAKSEIEKVKNTYTDALETYDASIDAYKTRISDKEAEVNDAEDKVSKTIAEYELKELNDGYDDYVASLDEDLAEKKEQYDLYVSCENGEDIIVYAPATGIYSNMDDQNIVPVLTGKVTAGTTIGYITDINSYLVYVNDYSLVTETNGYVKYGNSVVLTSMGKTVTGRAIGRNDLLEMTVRLDNDDDIVNISSAGASLTVTDIEISNVTLIDSSYVFSDTDGNYVFVEYEDSVVKKYITLGTIITGTNATCWVKSGLEPGDVCIKY
jgi:multidrug efflux pump subunit AcrA (membrane-fusion protein)